MRQNERYLTVKSTYPDARIDQAQDTLAGVSFEDPYRWLEIDSEEVRSWQRAQAKVASSYVREWPHFQRLRRLVSQFYTERFVSVPRYAGGRWFRTYTPDGASQAQVLVSERPMGEGRVLFDPVTYDPVRPPFLSWISPSPDGHTLAIGLCTDGSESNTITLIDVESGRFLADPPEQTLMDNWTGGVQWLPDSSAFFFSAISGAAIDFAQQAYLHVRAPIPRTAPLDIAWTAVKEWRMVVVSKDGRYAAAMERLTNPIPVALCHLGEHPLQWRPFITSVAGTVAGHIHGEWYVAVTDVDAPRGRLVAIPLNAPEPSNSGSWREIRAESDAALRAVTPVGELFYLTEFVDTYARIRIVDFDGKERGEVPLPGRGAISELPFPLMNLVPKGHPEKFLFAFSSLTTSAAICCHAPGQRGIDVIAEPQVIIQNAVVEDRWAVSKDGTRIPYHIVRRNDVDANRTQPTLIYAYGGWNFPLVPQFPGPMAAFVAAGAGHNSDPARTCPWSFYPKGDDRIDPSQHSSRPPHPIM